MKKKKTIKDLLKELDKSINYLSHLFRIPGMEQKDIKQELILKLLEDWKLYRDTDRGKGFWYLRLKWYLLNLVKASKRNPLNTSLDIGILNRE